MAKECVGYMMSQGALPWHHFHLYEQILNYLIVYSKMVKTENVGMRGIDTETAKPISRICQVT